MKYVKGIKLSDKKYKEYHADFVRHNKMMKNEPDLRYSSFEDYVMNRFGKKKHQKVFREMKVQRSKRVEKTEELKSLAGLQNSCCKKDRMQYNGTRIVGLATMHKSNTVAISKEEDPVAYATMRRS